jgi:hypothetical protein
MMVLAPSFRNKSFEAVVIYNDALRRRLAMRKSSTGHAGQAHSLTGAIAAYGKALAILTALQLREEFYTIIAQHELSEHIAAAS